MADLEKSDSDSHPENNLSWDLPSSSMSSGQLTDDPTRPYRKKYRSKSAVSTDPRSPYYTSQGFAVKDDPFKHGFTKAPSVSCVPGYDGHKYAEAASKSQLPFNGGIAGLNLSPDDPKAATIRQHYYPEGGWGYVVVVCAFLVEVISGGLQASVGLLILSVMSTFGKDATLVRTVIMGTSSISVTLLFTPIVVALSRRKSTRLLAILGGLVGALGCLFTSFATQFHQLFFSFGAILGVGFGLTRGTSSIMVGQYFKKRREVAEIFVICGTGVGMAGTPLLVNHVVSTLGWRLGLQAMTGLVSLTFILGIFYRPASLYHPQRRAILHLKGLQKRSKAKDKSLQPKDSKPPFFDFAVLKSRTVQILIAGSVLSAFGIYAPVLLLMYQGSKEGLDHDAILHLQAYLGLGSALGTASLGLLVVRNSINCFVAKQYLVQACVLMLGLVLLGFMKLREPGGYVLFAWVYGFFLGGYMYALKTFTFEKVRARNFARAWGFVQGCQGVPLLIGCALTGYLNELNDERIGFYFCSICIITGGLILYFIDVHKRNVQRQKSNATSANYGSERSTCAAADRRAYYNRRVTLQELADAKMLAKQHRVSADLMHKPELTCISEEAIMDNIFDDYVDDGITSCNKEEKYLMLSEFENNLLNTQESSSVSQDMRKLAQERKGREEDPPMLEHCPNCFKVVPMDGGALCDLDKVESPKKTHVSRSSAKKHTFSRRKDHKTKECTLQNDIIDEVTSSL